MSVISAKQAYKRYVQRFMPVISLKISLDSRCIFNLMEGAEREVPEQSGRREAEDSGNSGGYQPASKCNNTHYNEIYVYNRPYSSKICGKLPLIK